MQYRQADNIAEGQDQDEGWKPGDWLIRPPKQVTEQSVDAGWRMIWSGFYTDAPFEQDRSYAVEGAMFGEVLGQASGTVGLSPGSTVDLLPRVMVPAHEVQTLIDRVVEDYGARPIRFIAEKPRHNMVEGSFQPHARLMRMKSHNGWVDLKTLLHEISHGLDHPEDEGHHSEHGGHGDQWRAASYELYERYLGIPFEQSRALAESEFLTVGEKPVKPFKPLPRGPDTMLVEWKGKMMRWDEQAHVADKWAAEVVPWWEEWNTANDALRDEVKAVNDQIEAGVVFDDDFIDELNGRVYAHRDRKKELQADEKKLVTKLQRDWRDSLDAEKRAEWEMDRLSARSAKLRHAAFVSTLPGNEYKPVSGKGFLGKKAEERIVAAWQKQQEKGTPGTRAYEVAKAKFEWLEAGGRPPDPPEPPPPPAWTEPLSTFDPGSYEYALRMGTVDQPGGWQVGQVGDGDRVLFHGSGADMWNPQPGTMLADQSWAARETVAGDFDVEGQYVFEVVLPAGMTPVSPSKQFDPQVVGQLRSPEELAEQLGVEISDGVVQYTDPDSIQSATEGNMFEAVRPLTGQAADQMRVVKITRVDGHYCINHEQGVHCGQHHYTAEEARSHAGKLDDELWADWEDGQPVGTWEARKRVHDLGPPLPGHTPRRPADPSQLISRDAYDRARRGFGRPKAPLSPAVDVGTPPPATDVPKAKPEKPAKPIAPVKPLVKFEKEYDRVIRKGWLDPWAKEVSGKILEVADANQEYYAALEENRYWADWAAERDLPDEMRAAIAERHVNLEKHHRDKSISTFRTALGVDITPFLTQPEVAEWMGRKIDENVALIRTIQPRFHEAIAADITSQLMETPFDQAALRDVLKRKYKSAGYNLRRITRDQTNKMVGQLTEMRQGQLGIPKYRWSTSGDERVRPTHRFNDGKIFEWAKPPPTGHPGWDFQCRCTAAPIFDDETAAAGGPTAKLVAEKRRADRAPVMPVLKPGQTAEEALAEAEAAAKKKKAAAKRKREQMGRLRGLIREKVTLFGGDRWDESDSALVEKVANHVGWDLLALTGESDTQRRLFPPVEPGVVTPSPWRRRETMRGMRPQADDKAWRERAKRATPEEAHEWQQEALSGYRRALVRTDAEGVQSALLELKKSALAGELYTFTQERRVRNQFGPGTVVAGYTNRLTTSKQLSELSVVGGYQDESGFHPDEDGPFGPDKKHFRVDVDRVDLDMVQVNVTPMSGGKYGTGMGPEGEGQISLWMVGGMSNLPTVSEGALTVPYVPADSDARRELDEALAKFHRDKDFHAADKEAQVGERGPVYQRNAIVRRLVDVRAMYERIDRAFVDMETPFGEPRPESGLTAEQARFVFHRADYLSFMSPPGSLGVHPEHEKLIRDYVAEEVAKFDQAAHVEEFGYELDVEDVEAEAVTPVGDRLMEEHPGVFLDSDTVYDVVSNVLSTPKPVPFYTNGRRPEDGGQLRVVDDWRERVRLPSRTGDYVTDQAARIRQLQNNEQWMKDAIKQWRLVALVGTDRDRSVAIREAKKAGLAQGGLWHGTDANGIHNHGPFQPHSGAFYSTSQDHSYAFAGNGELTFNQFPGFEPPDWDGVVVDMWDRPGWSDSVNYIAFDPPEVTDRIVEGELHAVGAEPVTFRDDRLVELLRKVKPWNVEFMRDMNTRKSTVTDEMSWAHAGWRGDRLTTEDGLGRHLQQAWEETTGADEFYDWRDNVEDLYGHFADVDVNLDETDTTFVTEWRNPWDKTPFRIPPTYDRSRGELGWWVDNQLFGLEWAPMDASYEPDMSGF